MQCTRHLNLNFFVFLTSYRNTIINHSARIFSLSYFLIVLKTKVVLILLSCSILSTANESQEQTLIDGISALMIFCKSPELKAQGEIYKATKIIIMN